MSLVKKQHEIEKIRSAGNLVARVFIELKKMIKPGITTMSLNDFAEQMILDNGAFPTFKGYLGYPYSICASVNNQMVHSFPTTKTLKKGDIVSIDMAVTLDGYVGDSAFTTGVGEISLQNKKLIEATKLALDTAIKLAKPGATLGDLGFAIEQTAIDYGFKSTHQYVGHFIGKKMHEEPAVPNFGQNGDGLKLKEGMVLCLEPMFIDGEDELFTDPLDRWTVRTKHGGNATQEEHTILVTKDGGEILTK